MSQRLRLALFLLAMAALLPGFFAFGRAMPTFGDHPMPYGDAINQSAPKERLITNMVTAVNFDYRGFDTLGEEFMLFAAVTGTVVLLRGRRGETTTRPASIPGRRITPRSDAVVFACRTLASITLLYGLYVATHAQLTPGGGFQGGTIIASATLLVFLSEAYRLWRQEIRSGLLDALEGGGVALFALCGIAPLLAGGRFLENVLPLAPLKSLLSGGLILVENAGTTFAVAGGFSILILEFLEETREPADQEDGVDELAGPDAPPGKAASS